MVTSLPSRTMRALPNGTRYASSGTTPSTGWQRRCSRKITGVCPASAVSNMPFASNALDGATTCTPGKCANTDCRLWECWHPCPRERPTIPRITIGIRSCPPLM